MLYLETLQSCKRQNMTLDCRSQTKLHPVDLLYAGARDSLEYQANHGPGSLLDMRFNVTALYAGIIFKLSFRYVESITDSDINVFMSLVVMVLLTDH